MMQVFKAPSQLVISLAGRVVVPVELISDTNLAESRSSVALSNY